MQHPSDAHANLTRNENNGTSVGTQSRFSLNFLYHNTEEKKRLPMRKRVLNNLPNTVL